MPRNALRTPQQTVVMMHHPPRDPTPARTSQLADRMEAAYFESLLAQHGKASFIGGHVGGFFASEVDGVPHVVNGNSGKAPAENSGFTGWTLVGEITAEIRPHVDSLQLKTPGTVRLTEPGRVEATLRQGARTLPVAYPMAATWTGTPNLHIGKAHGVRPWHVAWFDPDTGVFTALRPGQVGIAVTVNGVTSRQDVRVGRPPAG